MHAATTCTELCQITLQLARADESPTERAQACKLSLRKCYKNAQERDIHLRSAECQNDLIGAGRPTAIMHHSGSICMC
jgi:hypothetical protein